MAATQVARFAAQIEKCGLLHVAATSVARFAAQIEKCTLVHWQNMPQNKQAWTGSPGAIRDNWRALGLPGMGELPPPSPQAAIITSSSLGVVLDCSGECFPDWPALAPAAGQSGSHSPRQSPFQIPCPVIPGPPLFEGFPARDSGRGPGVPT